MEMPQHLVKFCMRSIAERNQLAQANLGIVGYVVKTLMRRNDAVRAYGWNQAFSDGQLALLLACRDWPDDGRPFFPYASTCIRRAIVRGASQRIEAAFSDLLDKLYFARQETEWIRGEDVDAVNRAVASLGEVGRRGHGVGKVMRMLLDGKTPYEVSQELGIGRRAVSMAKVKGICKIQEILGV